MILKCVEGRKKWTGAQENIGFMATVNVAAYLLTLFLMALVGRPGAVVPACLGSSSRLSLPFS